MSDRASEFESKALELMALNIAFESARHGPFKGEPLLKLSEEIGDKAACGPEPGPSGSV